METLKWVGNLKGVEGRAGRRGLAGPAGLCMKFFFSPLSFFFSPSSLFCHRFPSAEPLFGFPAACQKELLSSERKSLKRNWTVCSPECFAKLHRDPTVKKGEEGAGCFCSRGSIVSFLVVWCQNKSYQCHL